MPIIPCLMGPTASGKSAVAMALAASLPLEIISVDSALVYRYMNIGTAKPTVEQRAQTPHHLVDILDPSESFSAGSFCRAASRAIEEVLQRQRIPLLVGGSMLYFHRLSAGVADLPAADPSVRAELQAQADSHGWSALHLKLQQVDPVAAARIHQHDTQRIQRALEIYHLTGKPISTLQAHNITRPYQFLNLIIEPCDRAVLHTRIENRLNTMFENDFIEEVEALYQRDDLHAQLPAMRCVGYRQVWQYLAGQCDYPRMRYTALTASRQLAKRQLTWLRRWPNGQRFSMEDSGLVETIRECCLHSLGGN